METVLPVLTSGGSAIAFVIAFLIADMLLSVLVEQRQQQVLRNTLFVLFGVVTLIFHIHAGSVGMTAHLGNGAILDLRGAAIAIALLFGGIAIGLLTAGAEILTRIWLGEFGTGADIIGIIGDFLLCAALLTYLRRHDKNWPGKSWTDGHETGAVGFPTILLAGCAVGLGEAISLVLISPDGIGFGPIGVRLFHQFGPALFIVQVFATVLFGLILDIQAERRAARREADAARHHSQLAALEEEAFRAGAITATTDCLLKIDLTGRIIEVSEAYARWSGLSRAELLGQKAESRNAELTHSQIVARNEEIKRKGRLVFETRHRHRDGTEHPVEISAVYSAEGDGAIIIFLRDISEREAAEQLRAEKNAVLKSSLEQAVGALASAMMHRDPGVAGHEERVQDLALALGRELGLDADRLAGLKLAAMVHDIGQIQIPSEILMRPQRLSPEEYDLVKLHAEAGARILQDITFPWPIAEIVHQHHENIDGSGYPRHLKGDEILLEARIIRVADSMEAMLSHRPFRRSHDRHEAIKRLLAGSGKQYDPLVVTACQHLFTTADYQFPDRIRHAA